MAQNGPIMTQNDPKWPKNDPKWPTITPNGPKMTPGLTHFFRKFFLTEKAVPQTFSLLECMDCLCKTEHMNCCCKIVPFWPDASGHLGAVQTEPNRPDHIGPNTGYPIVSKQLCWQKSCYFSMQCCPRHADT